MLGLFFDLWDRGDMFIRNVGWLLSGLRYIPERGPHLSGCFEWFRSNNTVVCRACLYLLADQIKESKGFWRWCITHRITEFLDFVHRPEFWMLEWLRWAVSKVPNRVGVSLSSPEDGNRSSFRNVVFKYLEFRTIDKSAENPAVLKSREMQTGDHLSSCM
jgi:hypothetical protein